MQNRGDADSGGLWNQVMNDPGSTMIGEAAPVHPAPGTEVTERLEYDGSGTDLAAIAVTNAIATLATLGIYRFWAKTRVRRYLWSRVGWRGDQGEYSGTGMELLRGFLVVLPVLALLFGSSFWIQMVSSVGDPVYWVLEFATILVFLFLICVAAYLARSYRLSRTEWRGIRFAQDGSSIRYAMLVLGWSVVVVLSLGTAYAVFRTRLQHYRTTHTSFGNRRFRFEARAAALLKTWLLAWLFLLPSLGLTYWWYRVREFRYFARTTHCGAFSFRSGFRIRSVILILIVGWLSILFAMTCLGLSLYTLAANAPPGDPGPTVLLGYVVAFAIALPVISALRMLFLVHPVVREMADTTSIIGEEDYATIAQSRQASPRRGEGLADALDVGAF